MRLFRTTMAALAVLALTATMAFAGRDEPMPQSAGFGLDTAGSASGHDVPMSAPDDDIEGEAELGDENETEDEAEVAQLEDEHCIAPESDEEGGEGATAQNGDENHGALVCGAARFGDWEEAGCDNHGQYVRTFANKNFEGEPGECEATTEDDIGETDETAHVTGNGGGNGKGHGNVGGNGRGRGRP